VSGPVVVVGAGIAGITTALEAAEAGQEVVLVERDPSVGGRVLKNHQYFPKMCPPACGMEINTRRLAKNPLVRVLTRTEPPVRHASRLGPVVAPAPPLVGEEQGAPAPAPAPSAAPPPVEPVVVSGGS
jgi:hypothetical protein